MNLNEIKSGRIGSYLPKKEGQLEIRCNDIELKQQLEMVLHKMLTKLEFDSTNSSYDWDSQDYKKFKQQLGHLPNSIFKEFAPLLLYYLDLSKEDLEKELRKIDFQLELHIFDDERIFKEKEEKIKNENGTETIIKKPGYYYVKHEFNTGDLISFIKAISSRKSIYEGIILRKYETTVDNNDSFDLQIEDIKNLLDAVRNNDQEVINLVICEYTKFINQLFKEEFIYNFLKDKLPQIIESNKVSLANKLLTLEQQKSRKIKDYIMIRNSTILSVKANYEKRRKG